MVSYKRTALSLVILASLLAGCMRAAMPAVTLVPTLALPTKPAATFPPTAAPTFTQAPVPTDTATPAPSPTPAPVELVGAGDIAYCGETNQGDEQTAALLERFPNAAIFTSGDNVYGEGTAAEYRNCFGASWGKFKDRIRPSAGNHDYMTDGAAPYYAYFGQAAGESGLGYYSYELGDWHIVALNSNCNDIACGTKSPQVEWLRQDLAQSNKKCTLLYWHHPRYSSGIAGGSGSVSTFWKVANEMGVDVVVNGHDHDYERFAPMDAEGNPSPEGVREFVVGSGGAALRDWGTIKPNSEVRYDHVHGIIKFNLYPDQYEWEFIPVGDASMTDSGTGMCH